MHAALFIIVSGHHHWQRQFKNYKEYGTISYNTKLNNTSTYTRVPGVNVSPQNFFPGVLVFFFGNFKCQKLVYTTNRSFCDQSIKNFAL